MNNYLSLVTEVLTAGEHTRNRTGVDTISKIGVQREYDLSDGFPLVTTKDMSGGRWNSLIHEFCWYLSGEHHIKNLREHTSIWDDWADELGFLDTAYGRFWRSYPQPARTKSFEAWCEPDTPWVNADGSIDQISYVLHQLDNNPDSRRIVVNAWHPGNATVSKLPPCHDRWVVNVKNGKLNIHLTQRSGDIALGVPFNIAAYSLMIELLCDYSGFEPGKLVHSITDAHIYCGKGERSNWYRKMSEGQTLRGEKPGTDDFDHVPGLLEQVQREPLDKPSVTVSGDPLNLSVDDIELHDYKSHDSIKFEVVP